MPPLKFLPDTVKVHPFDFEATMAKITEDTDWKTIEEAWPGGCRAKK